MAFKLPTMSRETSSSTSTGDMVMAGAQTGYFAFSAGLSNGDTTFLTFKMGSDEETGKYTYNSGADSFTRTQIYRSTNANAAVSWAPGTKDVICGLPGLSDLDAAGRSLFLTLLGTSTSANALVIGPNGTTNPTLQVDASAATAATGLKIVGAAATGGAALSVITSGTNENLTIDAAGTGTITLNGTASGNVTTPRVLSITNNTAASSTSTGALQVTGGAGIQGALWVAGAVSFTSAAINFGANSQATTLTINGGAGGSAAQLVIQSNGVTQLGLGSENAISGSGSTSKATVYSSSSTYRLFGLGAGTLVTDASGNVTVSSDARLKIDLDRPFTRTISDLMDDHGDLIAKPKAFRWRPESGNDGGEYVGFFAQDYEAGVPEAIGTDPRGFKTFNDRVAIGVLHNTAHDHEMRMRDLEKRLAR